MSREITMPMQNASIIGENDLHKLREYYLELMQSCLTGSIYRDESGAPFGDRVFDANLRKHGLDWPSMAQTMVGEKRLANLRVLVESVVAENIEGDLIETGVWRGGSCILMRAVLFALNETAKKVWVADSFEGLPKGDPLKYPADENSDFHLYPQLAISLEEVRENFQTYGFLDNRTEFLKGWFKDTLKSASIGKLSLIRLDGDMYESTMDALVALYPKLVSGGYVIVDDYHAVAACKLAVHDYCRNIEISPDILEIDGVGVYWRKMDIGLSFGSNASSISASGEIEEQIANLNRAVVSLGRIVIHQLTNALERLEQGRLQLKDELERLQSHHREQIDQFKDELDRQQSQHSAERSSLNSELAIQLTDCERAKRDLAAVYASSSWQITKPLRAGRRLLKKF